MALYDYAISRYESTKFWLRKLIAERKAEGASHHDIDTIELEAASCLEQGFYLVRFNFDKMMEGGVLPFFVEEGDDYDTAYVFVRDTGQRLQGGGILFLSDDGHFLRNNYWGDCVQVFQEPINKNT